MKHIRQINSVGTESYTIFTAKGYGGENEPPLENHPILTEHPDLFELVDCELPSYYQYTSYTYSE